MGQLYTYDTLCPILMLSYCIISQLRTIKCVHLIYSTTCISHGILSHFIFSQHAVKTTSPSRHARNLHSFPVLTPLLSYVHLSLQLLQVASLQMTVLPGSPEDAAKASKAGIIRPNVTGPHSRDSPAAADTQSSNSVTNGSANGSATGVSTGVIANGIGASNMSTYSQRTTGTTSDVAI